MLDKLNKLLDQDDIIFFRSWVENHIISLISGIMDIGGPTGSLCVDILWKYFDKPPQDVEKASLFASKILTCTQIEPERLSNYFLVEPILCQLVKKYNLQVPEAPTRLYLSSHPERHKSLSDIASIFKNGFHHDQDRYSQYLIAQYFSSISTTEHTLMVHLAVEASLATLDETVVAMWLGVILAHCDITNMPLLYKYMETSYKISGETLMRVIAHSDDQMFLNLQKLAILHDKCTGVEKTAWWSPLELFSILAKSIEYSTSKFQEMSFFTNTQAKSYLILLCEILIRDDARDAYSWRVLSFLDRLVHEMEC